MTTPAPANHTASVIPADVTVRHLIRLEQAFRAMPGAYNLPSPITTVYKGTSRHTDLDLEILAEWLEAMIARVTKSYQKASAAQTELFELQDQRDAVRAFFGVTGLPRQTVDELGKWADPESFTEKKEGNR